MLVIALTRSATGTGAASTKVRVVRMLNTKTSVARIVGIVEKHQLVCRHRRIVTGMRKAFDRLKRKFLIISR